MKRVRLLAILVPSLVVQAAWGQAPNPAEERARLANQRIQAEAERIAAEERARAETPTRNSAARAAGAGPAPSPPAPAAPAVSPSSQLPVIPTQQAPASAAGAVTAAQAADERASRALEPLRQLGELRDAGYVTDEEFERIKARILDDRF